MLFKKPIFPLPVTRNNFKFGHFENVVPLQSSVRKQILLDVYNSLGITGKEAEEILDSVHITVNKNTIPNETLSPMKASGIRIGSPAMTTRGLKEEDFITIGDIIYNVLNNYNNERALDREKKRVLSLTNKYKMYN